MSQPLKAGRILRTEKSGARCVVKTLLGEGGQGEVHLVEVAGDSMALKWYHPGYLAHDTTLADRLRTVIDWGQPSDRFLWPEELVSDDAGGVGYLMAVRPERFRGLDELLAGRIHPSFSALATAGFELAHSYSQLHAKGLCYKDINWGNVALDPATGEIRICDNDNVAINGDPHSLSVGTPGFMAPEVERGEAPTTTRTDLHALAVLLFYMFMMHHPLHGRRELDCICLDAEARRELYGTQPLFIFDPHDRSNAPEPGVQDAPILFWSLYPARLRQVFTKAFTVGLAQPAARVTEYEWKEALLALRDSILYCGCGKESFYDRDVLVARGGQPQSCWGCGRGLELPPRIRIGDRVVMLNHDTVLHPHHVNPRARYDFSRPTAKVDRHPVDGRWGLKNVGADKWVATGADGRLTEVPPGRALPLVLRTRINFGAAEGEIRI